MTNGRTRRISDGEMLMCRTIGHAWDQIPSDGLTRRGGSPWWLRCVRCMTERHDECEWGTGELLWRQYVYPEHYRNAFDEMFDAAPTRQDYRRLLFAEHLQKVRHLRSVGRAAG